MNNYTFKKSKFQSYNFDINEIDKSEKAKVYILWTGGWDSSFRVLQLSKKEVLIQPVYINDRRRKSTDYELQAIDSIANKIKELKSNKCKIFDLLILDTSEIKADPDITLAFNTLYHKKFIGDQYDYLARFAKSCRGIELCIHKDDKAFEIIETLGNIQNQSSEQIGEYYILDQLCRNTDLIKVFGDYHFPLLYHTKLDMRKIANLQGLTKIMDETWFCYSPINNEPCGFCNPCSYSIEEGMKYRFASKAIKRYRLNIIKKATKEKIGIFLRKLGLFSSAKKILNRYRTLIKLLIIPDF